LKKSILTLLLILGSIVSYTPNQYVQIGSKLVGTDYDGFPRQGCAVALSQDGKTAIVGGNTDSYIYGSAWIYTFNGIGDYKLTILDKWGNEIYYAEPI
jgi:hypothetical protein